MNETPIFLFRTPSRDSPLISFYFLEEKTEHSDLFRGQEQAPARKMELETLTVEKGLKPLLRLYGLPVSGNKPVLIKKLLDHEQVSA